MNNIFMNNIFMNNRLRPYFYPFDFVRSTVYAYMAVPPSLLLLLHIIIWQTFALPFIVSHRWPEMNHIT